MNVTVASGGGLILFHTTDLIRFCSLLVLGFFFVLLCMAWLCDEYNGTTAEECKLLREFGF